MKIEAFSDEKRPLAWKAYENYRRSLQRDPEGKLDGSAMAQGTQESPESKQVNETGACETCKNRKYQDGSDDAGVSFQTPTKVAPEMAASAVRGHEMEHVGRERGKANREDRKVVSQYVTYHNSICPECGDVYISGGTTRTTTSGKQEQPVRSAEQKPFDTYA